MIKLRFGAIAVLVMVFALSCENDVEEPTQVEENLMNIQAAKIWFEENYESANNLKPRWDKANQFRNSIEMPYSINGKVGLPKTEMGLEHLGRQRLVITKKESAYILTIIEYIPSANFQGDVKRIHSRNFKSEKFDGIITVQEFGHNKIKILRVEHGLIGSIQQANKENLSIQKVNCPQYEQCTLWFIFINSEFSYADETCNNYCAYEEITFADGSYDWPTDGESPFPWGGGTGSGGLGSFSGTYGAGQVNYPDSGPDSTDPDLNSDCHSWQFIPVGPNGAYQACAVTGIDLDMMSVYTNPYSLETKVEYMYYEFRTLYFEFPHMRADGTVISAGLAAELCAAAKDAAEEVLEARYEGGPLPPLNYTMEAAFLAEIRNHIEALGGRVSTIPNYGIVPNMPYTKSLFGNGGCL